LLSYLIFVTIFFICLMHSANQKREDYISWTDYFMGVALLSSKRSKDPIMQEGACIVNSDNHIIGVGYNGMPAGCSDDRMPWADQASSILETKHPYICHAALNAVVNKISNSAKGCRLYTTHLPCSHCAGLLIQSGVRSVYFLKNSLDTISAAATERLFKESGVHYEQYKTRTNKIVINFDDQSMHVR
ncbi:Deoxycytidylate deaminase, partial [Trichinella pseudospiralis]